MVLETGFISLPPRDGMPPLGASPDGLLLAWRDNPSKGGEPVRIALEFKSRFPFTKVSGKENGEDSYVWAPHKRFPDIMPPTHYAQVQLSMLAAQATSCLYLENTVQKTNVRVVPYDPVWLEAAIGEEPTAVAGPGAAASGPTTGGEWSAQ
ncbi:hypothetical protein GPECTOR_67g336 [Gonium pectorale]|uniref:YqaJ viral recombinase domain-containing protein n=1 Tax=Gonium pectorale TaxID=33097 RepID=A0A150G4N8_GONPE|nr:hypothetical protein GPECTOR_67g336 [Gonium pectorale]|eukprot:KXZ44495.1 hypothetical protein GPECTOR_67g336 [Gonium pectorale]